MYATASEIFKARIDTGEVVATVATMEGLSHACTILRTAEFYIVFTTARLYLNRTTLAIERSEEMPLDTFVVASAICDRYRVDVVLHNDSWYELTGRDIAVRSGPTEYANDDVAVLSEETFVLMGTGKSVVCDLDGGRCNVQRTVVYAKNNSMLAVEGDMLQSVTPSEPLRPPVLPPPTMAEAEAKRQRTSSGVPVDVILI